MRKNMHNFKKKDKRRKKEDSIYALPCLWAEETDTTAGIAVNDEGRADVYQIKKVF